ncbi:cold-shock protein [Ramlibacter sp.]|uniref:cold-shock protein n=1 Tax=Ramlibacter sp. TaxID=1917967 RepID=UPI003D0F4E2E
MKFYNLQKGYGFITTPGSQDYWFAGDQIKGTYKALISGDGVSFRHGVNERGQLRALDIEVVKRTSPNIQTSAQPLGGLAAGAAVGALLGPVGAVVGGLLGAVVGSMTNEKTSTCLRCNGTGYATGEGEGRTGYRCGGCGHRWTKLT